MIQFCRNKGETEVAEAMLITEHQPVLNKQLGASNGCSFTIRVFKLGVCEICYGEDGWALETGNCMDCCVFFDFVLLYYDYCNRIRIVNCL